VRLVKRIESADGQYRVEVFDLGGGLARYNCMRWYGPWEEDGVALDAGRWVQSSQSGYYETPEAAEAAAHIEVDWLRAQSARKD
jgi:hypothetical protein